MVQADLNRLSQWCNVNQLTVNVKKTNSVLFGTKKYLDIDRQPNLTLNNESIEYITHYKYLGIELDNNLNYKLHANNVYNVVAHKIYLLSKIRGFVSNKVALLIYKTKILPYLDYGDIFYMNTNMGILNKLQKLQNKALKICINSPWRTETDMVHNYTKIAKLDHRRTCHLRNFIHKRRDKEIYIDNTEFNTRRRDAVIMKISRVECRMYERSVYHRGAKEWTSLPVYDRSLESYNRFKSLQKHWLKSMVPLIEQENG